jgi:phosphoribosylformylglycinamidine synthase
VSTDGKGILVYLDPRNGGRAAVAEAARNVACAGARPLAVTNCLNFGNPERPEIMWQFAEAVAGMGEACRVFETPVTGGNVSLYNETLGTAIPPTPTIGMVGLLDDVDRRLGMGFDAGGLAVVLLGPTGDGRLGGSDYLKVIHAFEGSAPPSIDLELEKRLIDLLLDLNDRRLLRSAHDVSDGGLAVCLAESCFGVGGTPVGTSVTLPASPGRLDARLFGEAPSRVVVSCAEQDVETLLAAAGSARIPALRLGTTGGDRLVINAADGAAPLIDEPVAALADLWNNAIDRIMS